MRAPVRKRARRHNEFRHACTIDHTHLEKLLEGAQQLDAHGRVRPFVILVGDSDGIVFIVYTHTLNANVISDCIDVSLNTVCIVVHVFKGDKDKLFNREIPNASAVRDVSSRTS